MKSSKVRTADTLISRHVTRPHEVVYTVAGKPVVYNDISLALFVNGYLIVMEGEKQAVKSQMAHHLQELIADIDLYRWDKVWTFQAMWLKQIEQC